MIIKAGFCIYEKRPQLVGKTALVKKNEQDYDSREVVLDYACMFAAAYAIKSLGRTSIRIRGKGRHQLHGIATMEWPVQPEIEAAEELPDLLATSSERFPILEKDVGSISPRKPETPVQSSNQDEFSSQHPPKRARSPTKVVKTVPGQMLGTEELEIDQKTSVELWIFITKNNGNGKLQADVDTEGKALANYRNELTRIVNIRKEPKGRQSRIQQNEEL
nr:uncharacterized protein LOC109162154 isoform X1 [Ipomoea batatas]